MVQLPSHPQFVLRVNMLTKICNSLWIIFIIYSSVVHFRDQSISCLVQKMAPKAKCDFLKCLVLSTTQRYSTYCHRDRLKNLKTEMREFGYFFLK